jgi:hypothetical protein
LKSFSDLEIVIVRSRKSKTGDFRPNRSGAQVITLNNDLSPEQFLITLIHELAHYVDYKRRGRLNQPHGEKWKMIFKELMKPLQTTTVFSPAILIQLNDYMRNPGATTSGHVGLYSALTGGTHTLTVQMLNSGEKFLFRKRVFTVVRTLRKRIICREQNGREYLFQPHTPIETLR